MNSACLQEFLIYNFLQSVPRLDMNKKFFPVRWLVYATKNGRDSEINLPLKFKFGTFEFCAFEVERVR